jgi:hypothetical protein
MASSCPVCGFDGRSLSPPDAVVALRSFPRRYGGVLRKPGEETDEDDAEMEDAVGRRNASGWSALAHGQWAAQAIEALGNALYQVLVRDQPAVSLPPVDPPTAPSAAGGPGTVMARIEAATVKLAHTADGTKGDEWNRTGRLDDGSPVTAADLLRAAVHQGVHHLRLAEKVLREVVGRPG